MIRKSYAALRNLITSLPNPNPNPDPNPNPNPMLGGQVESESESEKTGSDPHQWFRESLTKKEEVTPVHYE